MKIPDYEDNYLLFGLLFMINNRLQVLGDTFYEEITIKQWFILVLLETFDNTPPNLNELAASVGSSHQNVKQLVLKLEQKGYVKLYTDEKDRRIVRIKMSPRCGELKQKYQVKQDEFMNSLFHGIDPVDLKSAVKVLFQMQENMEVM